MDKERQQQEHAATRVAAVTRGHNDRKATSQKKKSATAIQSRIRGRRARGRVTGVTGIQRYFTPAEVAQHERADDLWVSFFHHVYDLTPLIAQNKGSLVQPLLDAAGTDITHWFSPKSKDLRSHIDDKTELRAPFLPMGNLLHAPPPEASANWATDIGTTWWKNKNLCIGKLTRQVRTLKLLNMLTKQETTLEVCEEETLTEIQNRYLAYNQHAASYTWKHTGSQMCRVLEMNLTLDENDIPDEAPKFDSLDIDEDLYVPIVHLYFSDDLTVA